MYQLKLGKKCHRATLNSGGGPGENEPSLKLENSKRERIEIKLIDELGENSEIKGKR